MIDILERNSLFSISWLRAFFWCIDIWNLTMTSPWSFWPKIWPSRITIKWDSLAYTVAWCIISTPNRLLLGQDWFDDIFIIFHNYRQWLANEFIFKIFQGRGRASTKVACYKFERTAPHVVAHYFPENFLELRVAVWMRLVRKEHHIALYLIGTWAFWCIVCCYSVITADSFPDSYKPQANTRITLLATKLWTITVGLYLIVPWMCVLREGWQGIPHISTCG